MNTAPKNLRQSNLDRLDTRTFDVLILGGGINGAVSASSLTSRGASVALIDRNDFGSGTSQESSNLVWGGIKYLESYELGLVNKLCKSRNHLIRSYPSVVQELRFLATLDKQFRFPRLLIWAASWFYWVLGRFFTKRPLLLSASDIEGREPVIRTDASQGGLEYSDAFVKDNDARFVWRFVRAALDHGGVVANYVEAQGSKREGDVWVTEAVDRMSGRVITIRSKVLINACGPWVDPLNATNGITTGHKHLFSKGIHLVVRRLTAEPRCLAFFASDGRLFFCIPLGNKSCIGTTDTRVPEPTKEVTEEDRQFVLDNINGLLNLETPLTTDDIIAERCGVRPLVVEPSKDDDPDAKGQADWTKLSRKHAVEANVERAYISIFGGKLTDCLNVGDEIAEAVRGMGVPMAFFNIHWYGEPPAAVRDEFFHQARMIGLDGMTAKESSEHLSTRLWRRYGSRALDLLESIRQDPAMAEVLIEGTEYIRAEIQHAARCEMVTRLEDFLRRRSKIALVERTATIREAPGLGEACEILFGDDAGERISEYFNKHAPEA